MGVSFQDPKYPVGSLAPTLCQHRSESRAQCEPARNAVLLIIQHRPHGVCAIEVPAGTGTSGQEPPATTGLIVWLKACMWRASLLRGVCT